jgi:hypothetical protein
MTAIASDMTATSDESVADRLFRAVIGSLEVQAAYVGDRLGWYRELAAAGAMTAGELAERTGTDVRPTGEWLERQTASGYLAVLDADPTDATAPGDRRYVLPAGNVPVLGDEQSTAYLIPFARMAATFGKSLDDVVAGYRTGGIHPSRVTT